MSLGSYDIPKVFKAPLILSSWWVYKTSYLPKAFDLFPLPPWVFQEV